MEERLPGPAPAAALSDRRPLREDGSGVIQGSAPAIDNASGCQALVNAVGVTFARFALNDDALALDIVAVAVVEAVVHRNRQR